MPSEAQRSDVPSCLFADALLALVALAACVVFVLTWAQALRGSAW